MSEWVTVGARDIYCCNVGKLVFSGYLTRTRWETGKEFVNCYRVLTIVGFGLRFEVAHLSSKATLNPVASIPEVSDNRKQEESHLHTMPSEKLGIRLLDSLIIQIFSRSKMLSML